MIEMPSKCPICNEHLRKGIDCDGHFKWVEFEDHIEVEIFGNGWGRETLRLQGDEEKLEQRISVYRRQWQEFDRAMRCRICDERLELDSSAGYFATWKCLKGHYEKQANGNYATIVRIYTEVGVERFHLEDGWGDEEKLAARVKELRES